jgi:hypothetical protein
VNKYIPGAVTRRVLYHALVSVHGWSEYERIVGGVYPANGSNSARESPVGYGHDVDIPVVVADPEHPITAGVGNFTVHDEIYWDFASGATSRPCCASRPSASRQATRLRTHGRGGLRAVTNGSIGP